MNGFIQAQNTEQNFQNSIVKIAVSQICEASGFDSSQDSALETLLNIATRYLETLVCFAHSHANSYGRSQCHTGFSRASYCNRLILSFGVVKAIMDYVSLVEETPFGRPITRDTSSRERKRSYHSFTQSGKEPPYGHVPLWLLAFPDSLIRESNSERKGRFGVSEKKFNREPEGRFGVSEKEFNCEPSMIVHNGSHKLDSKFSCCGFARG
ncbi:hypothetical protein AMTRI_Chr11g154310 [Amborella trichopoda]